MCTNCPRPSHDAINVNCPIANILKLEHNTRLHLQLSQPFPCYENATRATVNSNNIFCKCHIIFLSTALVKVNDSDGHPHTARMLFDNGVVQLIL